MKEKYHVQTLGLKGKGRKRKEKYHVQTLGLLQKSIFQVFAHKRKEKEGKGRKNIMCKHLA